MVLFRKSMTILMQRGMYEQRQTLSEECIMTPNVPGGKKIHGIE